MSVYASDSFNRANAALGGSTLDNAFGGSETDAWVTLPGGGGEGTWAILSNQATSVDLGSVFGAGILIASSSKNDFQVSAKTYSLDCGVMARCSADFALNAGPTGCYVFYRNFSSGKGQLFKWAGGSFSQLGSDGPVIADGDVMMVQCNGTTIAGLINGSVAVSVTDSTYSAGYGGLYGGGGGTSTFDDVIYETVTAPTGFIGTPVMAIQAGRGNL